MFTARGRYYSCSRYHPLNNSTHWRLAVCGMMAVRFLWLKTRASKWLGWNLHFLVFDNFNIILRSCIITLTVHVTPEVTPQFAFSPYEWRNDRSGRAITYLFKQITKNKPRGKHSTMMQPRKVTPWLSLPRLYCNLGVIPGTIFMASDWHPKNKDID